jgi:hypothetical protein
MAVTLEVAARNAAVNAIVDLLDAGATMTYPQLQFKTAGGTTAYNNGEVATLDMTDATAFGNGSSGVATAGTIASDTSATGGTTTKATLYSQAQDPILSCSVGTSGADINLSNNVIAVGETVAITALTVTVPA